MVTVLLADDHGILRDGVKLLLESQGDIDVVASVANGREAVELAPRLGPDVAVLDDSMHGLSGIDAVRAIARVAPRVASLMLSEHDSPEMIRQALAAGAAGYMLKVAPGAELVHAVRVLAAGQHYLAAGLDLPALKGEGRGAPTSPLARLTEREREVLRLVVEGHSNGETARLLGLSKRTVETYRLRTMEKLRLDDLPALVKFAIREGLTSVR